MPPTVTTESMIGAYSCVRWVGFVLKAACKTSALLEVEK